MIKLIEKIRANGNVGGSSTFLLFADTATEIVALGNKATNVEGLSKGTVIPMGSRCMTGDDYEYVLGNTGWMQIDNSKTVGDAVIAFAAQNHTDEQKLDQNTDEIEGKLDALQARLDTTYNLINNHIVNRLAPWDPEIKKLSYIANYVDGLEDKLDTANSHLAAIVTNTTPEDN